ncbi:MAG: hypothetical protein ACJ8F7_03490 [Gemmataceae bacterium]
MTMRTPLRTLGEVGIANPCPVSWDTMPGDASRRHCATCNHTVHDLSQLTTSEAETLLEPGSTTCVRFQRHADGSVVTRDHPVAHWSVWRGILGVAASLVGSFFLAGCDFQQQTTRTMGTFCSPKDKEPVPKEKDKEPAPKEAGPRQQAPPPVGPEVELTDQ